AGLRPAPASGNGNVKCQSGSGFLLVWRGGVVWQDTPQTHPWGLHGIKNGVRSVSAGKRI
ncbi:hypothetical protein, partial [Stenotrophomonas sp. MA5]|uniref:hypothetical protein n=1 Tax=Stenotrophomonas sp. MA5 TaxID=2508572 RepID=UPI0019D6EEE8